MHNSVNAPRSGDVTASFMLRNMVTVDLQRISN